MRRLTRRQLGLCTAALLTAGLWTTAVFAQDVTTVKMVLWPGPEGDAMQKVVDAWNADQGTAQNIKVEMILLSRDDTFARETTEIATQSANVDIYFVASYNVNFYQQGLDPIDDLGIEQANYFAPVLDGLKIGGELYALPLDVSNHFLYYRKDLIDELLGSDALKAKYREISAKVLGTERDPKPADEWDGDDYLAMAAYFSQSANPDSPTRYGTALQLKTSPFNVTIWNDLLWGLGGRWTDESGKASLATPEGEKAMSLYRSIYEGRWTSPDSAQWEYSETNSALKNNDAAFAIQWSAAYAELTNPELSPTIAGKIAVAPVPGNPHSTHVHALAIALNKYSPNKEAAGVWMKYLATPEAMDAYAKAGGIPSMPKVLADNVSLNPVFAFISAHAGEYGYSPPLFTGTFTAMTQVIEALGPAWVGLSANADALADANAKLQTQLDSK